MKTVDLATQPFDTSILETAKTETVLLLGPDGQEFLLAAADDFEREVEQLRQSEKFQRFLDERSKDTSRISIQDVMKEIDAELERESASLKP